MSTQNSASKQLQDRVRCGSDDSSQGGRVDPERGLNSLLRLILHSDARVIFILIVFGLVLNVPGLGRLEFFRHTEADRSLIAWEMVERGDYVVPHLLGSPILTKPPLYYWLLAAVMKITGRADEFVLRLPSAIAAILLSVVFFAVARAVDVDRTRALLMTIILQTSLLFMTLAVVAEIDMVFCLLSSTALLALFLTCRRRSGLGICLAWIVCALAFLTKGPPVLVFFAIATGILAFEERKSGGNLGWFVRAHIAGFLCFVVPVGVWLSQVIALQGAEQLLASFNTEIVERVVAKPRNEKSFFFYIPSLFSGFLPWSLVAVLGCLSYPAVTRRSFWRSIVSFQHDSSISGATEGERQFFRFCTLLALVLLLLFSLARGKTPRYLFPAYPFFVPLCVAGCLLASCLIKKPRVARLLQATGAVLVLVALGFAFVPLAGVTWVGRATTVVVGLTFAMTLHWAAGRKSAQGVLLAILLLAITVRVGENLVYAQYRNATRSVQPIVQQIKLLIPTSTPVFTVEMFERWVVYYLKRDGYQVKRITESLIAGQMAERIVLLFSEDDEKWRVEQMGKYDATSRVLGTFRAGNTSVYLMEIAANALGHIKPRRFIPTVPSEPFYTESLSSTD